jgi:hypothetical protein
MWIQGIAHHSGCGSANEFAVTGANEFANTFMSDAVNLDEIEQLSPIQLRGRTVGNSRNGSVIGQNFFRKNGVQCRRQHAFESNFRQCRFLEFYGFEVSFNEFYRGFGATTLFFATFFGFFECQCFFATRVKMRPIRIFFVRFFASMIDFKKRCFVLIHAKTVRRMEAESRRSDENGNHPKGDYAVFKYVFHFFLYLELRRKVKEIAT